MGGAHPIEVARLDDVAAIAALLARSKADAMPWLAVVHTPAEDLWWVENVLLVEHGVSVVRDGDLLIAVLATSNGWLDQLYVAPGSQGAGIGRALVEHAKARSGGLLDLWAFQRNARARRFYEAAGFIAVEFTDGAGNEECEPDVRYRWVASEPS
jgi:GNAT superfamily N-acetyltransferase